VINYLNKNAICNQCQENSLSKDDTGGYKNLLNPDCEMIEIPIR
jgi:hypothetical protein